MDLRTELNDRTLRFDGVSIIDADLVAELLSRGVPPSKMRVKEITPDVQVFNLQVAPADILSDVVDEPVSIEMSWQLPQKYRDLDLDEYVGEKMSKMLGRTSDLSERLRMIDRVGSELAEIRRRGMVEFTKTVIYVLDTFREQGIVWGVGRGSSCASYVLFVLGLHVVDCLKYNVPMEEFFHD